MGSWKEKRISFICKKATSFKNVIQKNYIFMKKTTFFVVFDTQKKISN